MIRIYQQYFHTVFKIIILNRGLQLKVTYS